MGGAQPLAATMAGAAILCVEVDPTRIERRLETRYLDEATESLDDALARVRGGGGRGPGALGRPARERGRRRARARAPRRALRPRHRPDRGARSAERLRAAGARPSRRRPRSASADPDEYLRRASRVDRAPRRGLLEFVRAGSYVFDYGNNLRGEARRGRRRGRVHIPGLRPGLYPAALLPRHRAVPLGGAVGRSGRHRGDRRRRCGALFPDDVLLQRWLELAPERVAFQGLPARICWLGYGDRARAGLAINELVRSRRVSRPGRDRPRPPRLRLGRLALPRDRGDARRLRRDRRLADPQRAPEHRRGRDLGQRPPRRRRRASATRSTRAWSSSPTAPTTRPSGSSACSRPIRARASSATPTPATTEALDAAREHGLRLPGRTD